MKTVFWKTAYTYNQKTFTFVIEEIDDKALATKTMREVISKCCFLKIPQTGEIVIKKSNRKILQNPECVKALHNVNWAWVI